jgi:hypothetical protein
VSPIIRKQCYRIGLSKTGVFFTFLFALSLFAHAGSTVVFEEDFENGLGSFLIDNSFGRGNGLWHFSDSCAVPLAGHTQGGALYYGQAGVCNYDIGVANGGVVESRPINLTRYASGPIELRFNYFLETEILNCRSEIDPDYGVDVDLATVEISEDGQNYTVIARNCWRSGVTLLASRTPNWTESVVDLSDYAGSIIQLRFRFDTVDRLQNYYKGFFVDDIVVYGPPCEFTIAGDINRDCVVDMVDFATMEDFAVLAENWLLNCYYTPSEPGCVPD